MKRIDLKVPFKDKDLAKKLGAWWDPQNKVWFVPEKTNPFRFEKWLPPMIDWSPNIWANHFYIGQASRSCWQCKKSTQVYSFFLDRYELLDFTNGDGDSDPIMEWTTDPFPSFVYYISRLNQEAMGAIERFTSQYFLSSTKSYSESYYLNHCEHCGSKQGDFYLFEERSPFSPECTDDIQNLSLYRINQPFYAQGDTVLYNSFLDEVNIVKLCSKKNRNLKTKKSLFQRLFG